MFGIGMPELIIIMVIALVVIGPQKLPELARSLGKGMSEFKSAAEGFKQTIEDSTNVAENKEPVVKEAAAPEPLAAEKASADEPVSAETEGKTV